MRSILLHSSDITTLISYTDLYQNSTILCRPKQTTLNKVNYVSSNTRVQLNFASKLTYPTNHYPIHPVV